MRESRTPVSFTIYYNGCNRGGLLGYIRDSYESKRRLLLVAMSNPHIFVYVGCWLKDLRFQPPPTESIGAWTDHPYLGRYPARF
jgi:hypothetical protein